jgi:hypothetical protein
MWRLRAVGKFEPGHKKIPGSGRVKGQPSKQTLAAAERLRELDFDPLALMVELATDLNSSPELRGRMAAELASFIFPKRRATEVTAEVEARVQTVISGEPLSRDDFFATHGADVEPAE